MPGRGETYEIRWHGRGGQGAVTSSKILAAAAYRDGFAGATGAPSFGAERRGAPVTAQNRLNTDTVRDYSHVSAPDILIVLDESLLALPETTAGLKPGGTMIVNTTEPPSALDAPLGAHVVTADLVAAARDAGVVVGGTPIVNTAVLGAVAATGLVGIESLRTAIASAFAPAQAERNVRAAEIAFARTSCNSGTGWRIRDVG